MGKGQGVGGIYIAGHRGMVGSSIHRALEPAGEATLLTATSNDLDLRKTTAVDDCHVPNDCIDRRRQALFTSRGDAGLPGPATKTGLMDIRLHNNVTTTPVRRAAIQASDKPVWELAEGVGVSEDTIRRWRKRDTTEDGSHTAHRLRTALTPEQEAVVALSRTLWPSLEDILGVTREFLNENASRLAARRLLKRHGISTIPTEANPRRPSKPFKAYDPGYLHVDVKYLPQMADEDRRRYLFVAVDRANRGVYVQIRADKSASTARCFLCNLQKACQVRIRILLTNNGTEFTDRLFGARARGAFGGHEFDQLREELGIEHRLTRPETPLTNGMVERFNSRISEVLATHHLDSRVSSGADAQTVCAPVRSPSTAERPGPPAAHPGDEKLACRAARSFTESHGTTRAPTPDVISQ